MTMKRLIICADGTWNERDQLDEKTKKRHPTNVVKVARAIVPRDKEGTDQIVFYHDGLGTSGAWDKVTGGAFGEGIEQNVRNIYRTILYNYESGDELFLFGFSRGAFTVRTLVGFMNFVGLVQKDDDYYIPEIYGCYQHGQRQGSDEWTKAFHNVKDTRPCPPIRFIGVWDTVGALGAPGILGQFNKNKYEYHDVGLNRYVENAYHALAIDERRKPFAPSIWKRSNGFAGKLEQAWFAGVHSNVGGSCTPDGLANEALHWIIEKAEALGLEFDNTFLTHYRPCFNSIMQDSMSAMYKVMGENIRAIGVESPDSELVHQAALDRMNLASLAYQAPNLTKVVNRPGAIGIANTKRVNRGQPC
jgi:uncharacterized protein (DUF2235 family)